MVAAYYWIGFNGKVEGLDQVGPVQSVGFNVGSSEASPTSGFSKLESCSALVVQSVVKSGRVESKQKKREKNKKVRALID